MEYENYRAINPWTWRDKLRFKLFPHQHLELPEAPAEYKDCLVIKTCVYFDWKDRIRILLTGKAQIDTKTVTENTIGEHVTSSTAYPVLTHAN